MEAKVPFEWSSQLRSLQLKAPSLSLRLDSTWVGDGLVWGWGGVATDAKIVGESQ